jgi:hypothetical protein
MVHNWPSAVVGLSVYISGSELPGHILEHIPDSALKVGWSKPVRFNVA